jgi:Mor family transcriptional regulator
MAGHWGGQNIYFPMGLSYKLSQRDQAIYNEFNGINHSELARKHHVSLQWIYKIVKTVQKEETLSAKRICSCNKKRVSIGPASLSTV